MKLSHRFILLFSFVGLFIGTYFFLAHLVIEYRTIHTLIGSWDRKIPFLSWTFFIYTLVYVVPLYVILAINNKVAWMRMFWAFFVGLLFHWIVWFAYPVEYVLRPVIDTKTCSPFMKVVAGFFAFDSPALNCFPSLHVTYAFLTYFVFRTYKPRQGPIFLFLALIISLSTLTFKQHYLADVIAGFVMAVILKIVFLKPLSKGQEG